MIKPYRLQGIYEISLLPNHDHRGHVTKTYEQARFKEYGLDRGWVQEYRSYSIRKGTVRGLHVQLMPYTETKVVRVSKGAIFDVFVDVRKGSPTFGRWDSIVLTEQNEKMVYISKGFVHGFCTLEDHTEVITKSDNEYRPDYERGILWNDKTLNIPWPAVKPIVSAKDERLPTLEEWLEKHEFIDPGGMPHESARQHSDPHL